MQSERIPSDLQMNLLENAKKLIEDVQKRDPEKKCLHPKIESIDSKNDMEDTKPNILVASHHKRLGSMSNDSLDESIASLEFYIRQERKEKENEEITKEINEINDALSAIEFTLGIVEGTREASFDLSEGLSLSNSSRRGKFDGGKTISESNGIASGLQNPPFESRNDDGSREPSSMTESRFSSSSTEHLGPVNQCKQTNSTENKGHMIMNKEMKLQQNKATESDEIKQLRETNELLIGAIKALARATCAQARQRQSFKKKLDANKKDMTAN